MPHLNSSSGWSKKNGQTKIIHRLRRDGGQFAVGLYKNLFKSEWSANAHVHSCFVAGLLQVDSKANSELGAALTLQELQTAKPSLQSGKAPGIDGLPVDFYKSF